MQELQLPPTIRTPRPDEVSKSQEILDNIQRRQTANIVQGLPAIPFAVLDVLLSKCLNIGEPQAG